MGEALKKQEGGRHYKGLAIQPVEYIQKNGIGFMEGNAIKYLTRWRDKGGITDLKKAQHYVEMLIEFEEEKLPPSKAWRIRRSGPKKGVGVSRDQIALPKPVPFLERRRRKRQAERRKQQRQSEARKAKANRGARP